jgi:hypothetical protein
VVAALEKKLAAEAELMEKIRGRRTAKAPTPSPSQGKPAAKPQPIKVVDKTAAKSAPVVEHKRPNGSVIPSRDEMLALLDRRARGELDPD